MANYRIVCTTQEPFGEPPLHAHIVRVGVGADADRATDSMSLSEVLKAIAAGHVFYTLGETSQKIAIVERFRCNICERIGIRSTPDSVKDNNLDSLRYCSWKV